MVPRPAVMSAVEKLDYRVTVGDVAAQSGLDLSVAERELLSLATEAGGHMQVAESGEIAYKFDPNFRNVLLSRSFKLQVQAWLNVAWKWLFYLIRISFGILLVVSILIVVLGIIVALIALQSQNRDDDRRSNDDSRGGGDFFSPNIWVWWGNPFSVFDPGYDQPQRQVSSDDRDGEKMSFLESVFSFLFGDGNPNFDIEERRYRAIAKVIRNNNGVVTAEQVSPYLDDLGQISEGYEDYMIPVLIKFNGQPRVSDQGAIVYQFVELQTVASDRKKNKVGEYLIEELWEFSKAGSGKVTLSIGLGVFYLVAALFLGGLLQDPQLAVQLTGFLGFVSAAYGFLLGYAVLFLSVPLVRYFVLKSAVNPKIETRNQQRIIRANQLNQLAPELKQKLDFAKQFAISQDVISADNLAYTTETDLNDQEYAKLLKERGEE